MGSAIGVNRMKFAIDQRHFYVRTVLDGENRSGPKPGKT